MRSRIRLMVQLGLVFCLLLALYAVTGLRDGDRDPAQEAQETELPPLLSASSGEIREISWTDGTRAAGVRLEKDGWRIVGYDELAAVRDRAEALAAELAAMRPVRLIGTGGSPASYGLDESTRSLKVELADGRQEEYTVGRRLSSGFYYVSDKAGRVCVMPGAFSEICSLTPAQLAVTEQIPLITDKTKVEIRTREHTLTAEKTGALEEYTWSSHYIWFAEQDGKRLPLDTVKLEALCSAVRRMEFTEILEVAAGAGEIRDYGLDDPDIVFEIRGKEQSTRVLFKEEGNGSWFCMQEGSDMICGTGAEVPGSLLAAALPDGLRAEDVCRLDWETVTAFDVILDGQRFRIERSYDAQTGKSIYRQSGVRAENADGTENAGSTDAGRPVPEEKIIRLREYLEKVESSGQWDGQPESGKELAGFVFYRNTEHFSVIEMRFYECTERFALESFLGEKRQLVSVYAAEGIRTLAAELVREETA